MVATTILMLAISFFLSLYIFISMFMYWYNIHYLRHLSHGCHISSVSCIIDKCDHRVCCYLNLVRYGILGVYSPNSFWSDRNVCYWLIASMCHCFDFLSQLVVGSKIYNYKKLNTRENVYNVGSSSAMELVRLATHICSI